MKINRFGIWAKYNEIILMMNSNKYCLYLKGLMKNNLILIVLKYYMNPNNQTIHNKLNMKIYQPIILKKINKLRIFLIFNNNPSHKCHACHKFHNIIFLIFNYKILLSCLKCLNNHIMILTNKKWSTINLLWIWWHFMNIIWIILKIWLCKKIKKYKLILFLIL